MIPTTIKRTIATTLSGAAIAGTLGAPAASAMPIDPVATSGEYSGPHAGPPTWPVNPEPIAPRAQAPEAGFDLSLAAIGAAAGTGLLIAVLAAGGMAWRRPMTRGQRAARA
jgi:hypothetical protein